MVPSRISYILFLAFVHMGTVPGAEISFSLKSISDDWLHSAARFPTPMEMPDASWLPTGVMKRSEMKRYLSPHFFCNNSFVKYVLPEIQAASMIQKSKKIWLN